mmetsp:Transcript_9653/g.8474  ORF Transcript_9653/g.8474 Transcript_9653/m.8474 type:complete len:100 (+) Transcript_9653:2027-2326(+)
MLDYDEFRQFVSNQYTSAHFDLLQSNIEQIITDVSFAASTSMESRPNTFQILGWDFMIDDSLKVWLIETNRSPDLSPSTSITKKLTEQLWVDLAKMFCD